MAILVEKKTGIIDNLGVDKPINKEQKKAKNVVKKSFIAGYIDELRDVEWPTFRQSVNWFFITILICLFLGLFVLSFDNLYRSSFKFIECTSPVGKNLSPAECIKEFPKNLFNQ